MLRVKQEADSDYHLVLSDSGGRTMIAEIPSPSCIGSSPFLPSIRYVRSKFTAAYHPTDFWSRPNVSVQVTGVGSGRGAIRRRRETRAESPCPRYPSAAHCC